LKSKATGQYFVEVGTVETLNQNETPLSITENVEAITPRRKRKRQTIEVNADSNDGVLEITLPESGSNSNDNMQNEDQVRNTINLISNVQKKPRRNELELYWEYDKPCRHCDYVHLKGASAGQKKKCCLDGKALQEPFPQLKPLPPMMLHYARDRIQHMGRNSVSYNSVLSCAATGVENNDGGGFEHIHGEHAVRLHGRTYHFLTTSTGNAGLNFFTFDNLANCTNYATCSYAYLDKSL